jgi:hypothetical protein
VSDGTEGPRISCTSFSLCLLPVTKTSGREADAMLQVNNSKLSTIMAAPRPVEEGPRAMAHKDLSSDALIIALCAFGDVYITDTPGRSQMLPARYANAIKAEFEKQRPPVAWRDKCKDEIKKYITANDPGDSLRWHDAFVRVLDAYKAAISEIQESIGDSPNVSGARRREARLNLL